MKGGSCASPRQQYALDPWQQSSQLLGLWQPLRGPCSRPVIDQERHGFPFRGEIHDTHTHTIFQNDRASVQVAEHFQIFYFLLRSPSSLPWEELQLQDIDLARNKESSMKDPYGHPK